MKKELQATTQRSYYGKALIERTENGSILTSYTTEVCKIVDNQFIKLWNGYSSTTMKHVNDYRLLNGLSRINKKEWLALPCNNNERYGVGITNGFYNAKTSVIFDNYEDAENYAESISGYGRVGYVID